MKYEFNLNATEEKRFEEFKQYIRVEFGERHFKKARFEFIFHPNGIATEVTVRETVSGEERNISDLESW